jgi:hypothetical protein
LRGKQTDDTEPSLPKDLPKNDVQPDNHDVSPAETKEATLGADQAAQDAAEVVISDALTLVASLQDLSCDNMFSLSAPSSDQGDNNPLIPCSFPSSNPFNCMPVDPLPPSETHTHVPNPFHVREIQHRGARTKWVHDEGGETAP